MAAFAAPAPGLVFWLVAAGIVGLVVGSFINVVILRLPRIMDAEWHLAAAEIQETPPPDDADASLSLAWPPSACTHCDARLKPWHNIPVFSFMVLGGRCHHCHARISSQYPLVETAAAVIGMLAVWHFGATPAAVGAIVLGWLLLPTALIDARTGLLPDNLTLALLWLGLIASLLQPYGLTATTPAQAITGAALGYGGLWLIERAFYLVAGRRGMGHGDFKLTAALCAWLGAISLPLILLLAACLGLIMSAALGLIGRFNQARQIAFGPWLALAGWISLLYGPWLIDTYTAAAGLH